MSQTIDVNGQSINYPETGDTNWGDEATDFAVQTSAAFGKLGLASGTSVDIAQTLDVTGNTTLDANLSVAGTTSLTGNVTLTNNLTVNGNTNLGNANTDTTTVTGIVNVDSGVLYVDPVNNRVGINDTTPSQALDVTGNVAITGNETVGGTLDVTGATSLSSTLAVTGNSTLTGNLSVNGNTTLGDASGDSITINSNGVSIPNGLNFDSNTLVIDATNNKIGIGTNTPNNYSDSNTISQTILRTDQSLTFGTYYQSGIGQYSFINSASGNKNTAQPLKIRTGDIDKLEIAANGQLNAVVPGGSTLYPGYLCRAWANFNGTLSTPISPRASGNVTSITDNSTGNYTVNLTTSMPDTDYSVVGASGFVSNGGVLAISDYTVSSFRVRIYNANDTIIDSSIVNLAVFR